MDSQDPFPTESNPEKVCDSCGAPASWADERTMNLTWKQAIRYRTSAYLASARMWPIGYILASPYSPLQLEQQLPKHNWRDAFEDLLALDSGGQMIDQKTRNKEKAVAEDFWYQTKHRQVSSVNRQLEWHRKYRELLKDVRATFVRINDVENITAIDNLIPEEKKLVEDLIAVGEDKVALAADSTNKGRPASKYKRMGQWIASLISSGAIVGWVAHHYNSSDGDQIHLRKADLNEDGEPDGMPFAETQLGSYFFHKAEMQYGTLPTWSTAIGQYPSFAFAQPPSDTPQDQSISDEGTQDSESDRSTFTISPTSLMPKSVLSQDLRAERTILSNGRISVNVMLTTWLTNGQSEEKEFRDNPIGVMEEVERVYRSNEDVHDALRRAGNDQVLAAQKEIVQMYAEDDID